MTDSIEIQVARILFLIAKQPNHRHAPVEGDIRGDFTFWFDGGAVKHGKDATTYTFLDGSVATTNRDGTLGVTIGLADGRRIVVGEGEQAAPLKRPPRMDLEMLTGRFGPFAEAFDFVDDSSGYDALKHIGDGEQAMVVALRIGDALTTPDAGRHVQALLADMDWRGHLVAAMAYLIDQTDRLSRRWLWNAIDRGSWVIPQLVATALLTDRNFAIRARLRVARGCPIVDPDAPEHPHDRSAKMLASILGVAAMSPGLKRFEAKWWAQWWADPRYAPLLDMDAERDRSEILASNWLLAVLRMFDRRGAKLVPAEFEGPVPPRLRQVASSLVATVLAPRAPRLSAAEIEANTRFRGERHRITDTLDFYSRVVATGRVWSLRDANGVPTRVGAGGLRAQPYWSDRDQVGRVIMRVPGYDQFIAFSMDWSTLQGEVFPRLAEDGVQVGINWSDVDASGYSYDPRWVSECVDEELRRHGNRDLPVFPEGLTLGAGDGTSPATPVSIGGSGADVHAYLAIMGWLEARYGRERVQWRLEAAAPSTEVDRTTHAATVELPDRSRHTHYFEVRNTSAAAVVGGTRTYSMRLAGRPGAECTIPKCWVGGRMTSTGWAEFSEVDGRWMLECRCRTHGVTLCDGGPSRTLVDEVLAEVGLRG